MFCAALAASVSLFPAAALAQSAAAAPTRSEIDEIVVTATRQAQRLQDVPMSVDVATGDDLQKLNIFDTKDIQQLSPGLELTNTTGRNNTTTLRGISFDPDQGTSPSVMVYLNEIPSDAQTVYTALYDIEQIEVLRGPQGSLRGIASPAGAITIRTRRPDFDQTSGFAQATATEDRAYNVQGGVTLPISDTFAMRAAVLVDGNRVNQVYNVNRNEHSRGRTESARLTLGWRPTPDINAYLTYQYLESDVVQNPQVFGPGNAPSLAFGDPTRSGPPADAGDYIAVTEGITRFKNRSHILNLNADWDIGPVTLSFAGAHQDSRLDQLRDLDTTNSIPNYANEQHTVTPYLVNTAELRLSSNNSDFWNWSVGTFYQKQKGTTRVTQPSDSFFGPFPISSGLFLPIDTDVTVPVDVRTLSFNATSSFRFGDFTLEAAIRYSELKNIQTATVHVVSPGFPGVAPAFDITQDGVPTDLQKAVDHPLTGGASLSYRLTDDATVYAAYAHSYRQGSAGVAVPVGVSSDLIRSSSEKTDSFEIGFKAAFLNRRLNVNVAAFYQKFDGFLSRFDGIAYNCPDFFGSCNAFGPPINNQTDNPLTNGSFSFNYNGDATVKGIEGTIEGRPLDNWDISISAAYAKGRYDGALLPCNDYNGDGIPDATGTPHITGTGNVSLCASDGRLADVPDFSLSANSELRLPIGALTPFIRGIITYRPGVYSERSDFDYSSRTLLNLYVGLRGENDRWEVNLSAKNILNQKRITNISLGNGQTGTATAPYDSGYRAVNVMNPREFGITTSFKF